MWDEGKVCAVTKSLPPTGEGGGSRGAWLDRVRRAKSLPPCGEGGFSTEGRKDG